MVLLFSQLSHNKIHFWFKLSTLTMGKFVNFILVNVTDQNLGLTYLVCIVGFLLSVLANALVLIFISKDSKGRNWHGHC